MHACRFLLPELREATRDGCAEGELLGDISTGEGSGTSTPSGASTPSSSADKSWLQAEADEDAAASCSGERGAVASRQKP